MSTPAERVRTYLDQLPRVYPQIARDPDLFAALAIDGVFSFAADRPLELTVGDLTALLEIAEETERTHAAIRTMMGGGSPTGRRAPSPSPDEIAREIVPGLAVLPSAVTHVYVLGCMTTRVVLRNGLSYAVELHRDEVLEALGFDRAPQDPEPTELRP